METLDLRKCVFKKRTIHPVKAQCLSGLWRGLLNLMCRVRVSRLQRERKGRTERREEGKKREKRKDGEILDVIVTRTHKEEGSE